MIARARAFVRVETFVVLVALAVLACVSVVRQRDKGDVVPLDSYSSDDAASGGYRAFAELLSREGLRIGRFRQRPAYLDATVDTLVYAEPLPFDPRSDGQQTTADAAALDAWVRGGGRLLYLGFDDAAARAGILGLPRTLRARSHAAKRADAFANAGVADVRSHATTRYRTPHRVRDALDDGRGALVATYARGRGSVVAIVDESLFRNDALATADRARLAYAVARPAHAGGLVAFDEAIHGEVVATHWWEVVPRPLLAALGLAGVALAIAMAGAAVRLGPPLVPEPRTDLGTGEFAGALASLLRRGRGGAKVLRDAERSTARILGRTCAAPDGAGGETLAGLLATDDERGAYRSLVALASADTVRDADVLRGIALAQRLRKDAAAHARPRS